MQQQPIEHAITTADLVSDLGPDDLKCTLRDFFFGAGQVATALSVCWMVHCLA